VRAQVRTAVTTHERHIGKQPKGIWVPECGYRPAGPWSFPVTMEDGSPVGETTERGGFERIGVEQALAESGLEFFFVDTHLVEESARIQSPYAPASGHVVGKDAESMTFAQHRRLYQPYYVDGPYDNDAKRSAVTIFPRDPRTGMQVWSGDHGYPGDPNYLDFHKKRWPGGHRYWAVTGAGVDMNDKRQYDPRAAAERIQAHASHFVHLVWESLQEGMKDSIPPILCSPFDAELFGHWWFEGPLWLEAVARTLHDYPIGIALTTCSEYLERYPRAGFIAMHEGSWGAEGANHVWMNPETNWTYSRIYPAELYVREVCTKGAWRETGMGQRIVKQLCRELLLLESSDWQFLITTGAARDYAELRFETHHGQFQELKSMWESFEADGAIGQEQEARLAAIEHRDSVFADIDPSHWAQGARERRVAPQAVAPAATVSPLRDATVSEIPKFLSGSGM
jgi:1,4-alpha-glucan branching enzyme